MGNYTHIPVQAALRGACCDQAAEFYSDVCLHLRMGLQLLYVRMKSEPHYEYMSHVYHSILTEPVARRDMLNCYISTPR